MDFLAAGLPILGNLVQEGEGLLNSWISRRWQEKMYNEYNSPSALVRQYGDAGLNPALMFGGQTPAAPTDTQAAPTPENAFGTVTGMVAQLLNLEQVPAAIDKLTAEAEAARAAAEKSRADARGQNIENEYKPRLLDQQLRKGDIDIEQARYGIAEAIARINNIEADTLNKEEQQFLIRAQKYLAIAQATLANKQSGLVSAQTVEQEFSNKVFKETGNKPNTPIWNLLPGVSTRGSEELDKFGNWLSKVLSQPDVENGPASGFTADMK